MPYILMIEAVCIPESNINTGYRKTNKPPRNSVRPEINIPNFKFETLYSLTNLKLILPLTLGWKLIFAV